MMAATTIDSFMKKLKDIRQQDIDSLCNTIAQLIMNQEKAVECCGLLRQLFVILQSLKTKVKLSISDSLVCSLVQLASLSSGQKTSNSANKCILCQMIFAEILSEVDGKEFLYQKLDSEHNFSSTYLLQGKNTTCITKGLQSAVRCLQSQDFDSQMSALAFVTSVSLLCGNFMDIPTAVITSESLAHWLSSASIKQAPNAFALNPFRKDEENTVTEVDGTPNTNIFTVLSIGQYYTGDQIMNIFSFSVLFKWLLGVHTCLENKFTSLPGSEVSGDSKQEHSARKKIMELLVPKSVDYCFRVIDQCERRAKVQSDFDLQVACLVEAIQVLDIICSLDKTQTARVFQEVKRLNTRIMQDKAHVPVMVHILRFFFHHSTSVVHDPQETFQYYFQTVVLTHFKNQGIMYDTMEFLMENITKIAEKTDILTHYFPNLFKILAWHPRIFIVEFTALIPVMMNWDTSIEILHLILDLPCMTAALEVVERAKETEPLVVNVDSEPSSSLEAYYNPRFRPLFSYIIRCESGQGDTIDRLAHLHSMLRDCISSTRVMVCCQLVPLLLKIWFQTVLESEDPRFISQLLPVLTDRSSLVFGVPELIEDVHKVFAEKLLVLCKRFPEIVTRQHLDLCDFVQATANMAGRVAIYSNLIFAIGEYSSQVYSPNCTSEVIGKYYESLEVVTYEFVNHLGSQDFNAGIPKILSSLMSVLSKLASRSQDLIPRAILCLTKVAKQQNLITLSPFTKDFLTHKAASLIALLKNPESACLILSPKAEIKPGRCHLNNSSITSALRGIHRLIKD